MKAKQLEKRGVSPRMAIEVLSKNGCEISEAEAENILDFLYFLSKLTVEQHLTAPSKLKNYSHEDS